MEYAPVNIAIISPRLHSANANANIPMPATATRTQATLSRRNMSFVKIDAALMRHVSREDSKAETIARDSMTKTIMNIIGHYLKVGNHGR